MVVDGIVYPHGEEPTQTDWGMCGAQWIDGNNLRWVCTRPGKHAGRHEAAGTTDLVYASWSEQ